MSDGINKSLTKGHLKLAAALIQVSVVRQFTMLMRISFAQMLEFLVDFMKMKARKFQNAGNGNYTNNLKMWIWFCKIKYK